MSLAIIHANLLIPQLIYWSTANCFGRHPLQRVPAFLHLSSHVFPGSLSPLVLILTGWPSLQEILISFDALLLESRVDCSLKERRVLLWWLEPAVGPRACFPHWVPAFTILFSFRLVSRALLLATGRGVSTSVLVSHVDSVSLVQLSWYLGSMMASARLPPQPIEKTIQGRCSSSSGPTRNDQRLDSCHTTILPASTPSASPFPCLVSPKVCLVSDQ